jgi:dienelactone hydrolase
MGGIGIAALAVALAPAGIPTGSSRIGVEVEGRRFTVYTYKPAGYRDGPMILVFHGLWRNPEEYPDDARRMGDRFGALIAAPEFTEEEYPFQKYTRGAVLREDGTVAPRSEWTWSLVPKLADALRRR